MSIKSSSKNINPENIIQTFNLLSTKLSIPFRHPNWITRVRLLKRLDEALKCRLAIISAPAGFGKTTLLTDWIYSQKIWAAWFSVEKGNDTPFNFLTHVIACLQKLEKEIGKASMVMLQSPTPPPIETILINLINDIVHISKDAVIVFDDYQNITNKLVHEIISFFLDHLPNRIHLVIATRSSLPLPLARLRSQNQIIELRAADLSFTADETADFYDRSFNLHLSIEDVRSLETRTEGWIAALQLAAISIRGREDVSSFINTFKGDNRYIADYLTEEVLNRQSEQLRNFLLQTSILGRLSGPLCDAVTLQNNSQEILRILEKANLFIIPLDDEHCWYRYHHLFADLLKHRLYSTKDEIVSEIHIRASKWLAKNDFKNEAVEQALIAKEYVTAVTLIEEIAEIEWSHARESRLLQWIKKLPDDQIGANPKICILYAKELFHDGLLAESEKQIKRAELLLESTKLENTLKKELEGKITVIRTFLSSRVGDVPNMIRFASKSLKLLSQKDLVWRGVAATTLGFAYGWMGTGDLKKAENAFLDAVKFSETGKNVFYNIFARICLVAVLQQRCQFKEAEEICYQTLNLINENRLSQTELAGSLYSNLGLIYCEWNNLDKGIELIKKGIELNRHGRDPVTLASCQIGLLRALIFKMDYVSAVGLLKILNESAREFMFPPWITGAISAYNIFFWLIKNDLTAALKWVKDRGISADEKLTNLREMEHLALAHVLILKKQYDEADNLLQRLINNAKTGDRIYMVIEITLWRALFYKERGDSSSALRELKSALSLSEPGALISIFVSKGKPIEDLLKNITEAKKGSHLDAESTFSMSYAKKISAVFKSKMPPKTIGVLESLSEREREVLHLIAAGLSNREIAEKLFISLNTVKTHTKNINSKLGVTNRIRASSKAKELGII